MSPRTRIGSDDARRWVRSLRLGNPYAKAVLMAFTNYVNDDGTAYPGLETIHGDTEIAINTITARLRWCEAIGAVTVSKCWVDEHGNRNKVGRGRPTSWEIRFLLDADVEAIAAAADEQAPDRPLRGSAKTKHEEKNAKSGGADCEDGGSIVPENGEESGGAESEFCQSPGHTLEKDLPISSQSVANHLPITGATRILESESEEDSNPKPLSKDERGLPSGIEDDSEFEKDWEDFRTSGYPDGIIDIPKARVEMKKIPHDRRRAGIIGVPAFADYCRKRGQKNPKPAHIYWRHGVWEGLSAISSVDGAMRVTSHSPQSEAGKALCVLAAIAGHSLFRLPNGNISYVNPVTAQLLALAETPPESDWIECALGDQSFAAWRGLIYRIFAGRTLRASVKYRVPWRWPPATDGKIYTGIGPPDELSDADAQALMT